MKGQFHLEILFEIRSSLLLKLLKVSFRDWVLERRLGNSSHGVQRGGNEATSVWEGKRQTTSFPLRSVTDETVMGRGTDLRLRIRTCRIMISTDCCF
jgi:hypothetical protein